MREINFKINNKKNIADHKHLNETSDYTQNVLMNEFMLDSNNKYEQDKTEMSDSKLRMNEEIVNNINIKKKDEQNFYNLPIITIFKNLSKVLINILNELILFIYSDDKSLKKLSEIFLKKERLIYIGILFVSLAIIFNLLIL